MPDTHTLLHTAYRAFNHRDIDAALATMTEDVRWPRASEGGEVLGHAEIRAYWTRQWAEFDPHVDPRDLSDQPDGTVLVRVHQLVRDLRGNLLSDSEVHHAFTFRDGLIARMALIPATPGTADSAAAAFSHR